VTDQEATPPEEAAQRSALGISIPEEQRERLLSGQMDEEYLSHADRQAVRERELHSDNHLIGLAIEAAREEANREERMRVQEMTDKDRERHRERIGKVEKDCDQARELAVNLLAEVKGRDIAATAAIRAVGDLERQLEELKRERQEILGVVYRTEIIRANPHRYMDHFYSRFSSASGVGVGEILSRPGLSWSVDNTKKKRR